MKKIIATTPIEKLRRPTDLKKTAKALFLSAAAYFFETPEDGTITPAQHILNKEAYKNYLATVSRWAQQLILEEAKDPQERAKIIIDLIKIAEISQENYAELDIGNALITALNTHAIQSLTLTWCHLPREEYQQFQNSLTKTARLSRLARMERPEIIAESLAKKAAPYQAENIDTTHKKIERLNRHAADLDDHFMGQSCGPPKYSCLDEQAFEYGQKSHQERLKETLEQQKRALYHQTFNEMDSAEAYTHSLKIGSDYITTEDSLKEQAQLLSMHEKSLQDVHPQFIHVLLRNGTLDQATEIDLSGLNLRPSDIEELAHFIRENKTIKILKLNSVLSDQDTSLIPLIQAIQANTTLQELEIKHNHISVKKMQNVLELLAQNKTLIRLDISENPLQSIQSRFTKTSIVSSIKSFMKESRAHDLTLNHCGLDDDEVQATTRAIARYNHRPQEQLPASTTSS